MNFGKWLSNTVVAVGLVSFTGCASLQPAGNLGEVISAVPTEAPPQLTTVNKEHQFVVIDFGGRPIPPVGQELRVGRGQENVGRVRITEPMRGRFVTGDIVEGDLRVGDAIR